LTGALTGAVVLLVLALLVTGWYAVAAQKAAGHTPGEPDKLSEEVTSRLMAELRKWQAEAAHWKATAERLQRELDGKQ
jgi:hypothetical protein